MRNVLTFDPLAYRSKATEDASTAFNNRLLSYL